MAPILRPPSGVGAMSRSSSMPARLTRRLGVTSRAFISATSVAPPARQRPSASLARRVDACPPPRRWLGGGGLHSASVRLHEGTGFDHGGEGPHEAGAERLRLLFHHAQAEPAKPADHGDVC